MSKKLNLSSYIATYKPLISHHLISFLQHKKKVLPFPDQLDIIDRLIQFAPQGKLLRGILLVLAQEMNGKKCTRNTLKAAAAIEIIHSGILIHDDIMDSDTVRRGQKTIFAQYADLANELKITDAISFGKAIGICSGDVAFSFAYELLNQAIKNTSRRFYHILKTFTEEIELVNIAQVNDLVYSSTTKEISHEQIINLYRFKTARYSFSLPLKLGALFADAHSSTIKYLEQYGELIGIIFQIKDDELDLFGTEKIIGKPVGSDIRENKKTLLRALVFEKASSREKIKLRQIFGKSQITEKDVLFIKKVISKYQIETNLDKTMKFLFKQSQSIARKLPGNKKYHNILTQLAEFNLVRKR